MKCARLGLACLALVLVAGPRQASCAEESQIRVHSLTLKGVQRVDATQLKSALATRVTSRLPWGKKTTFDRARFLSDLDRIRAFYVDHGFPDARVSSFDLQLDKQKTRVDLTITVSEGEPILVSAIDVTGTGDVPPSHIQAALKTAPLKVGQPLDRPAMAATREEILFELRDHGYPLASVTVDHKPGPTPRTAIVTFNGKPGELTYFGPTEVTGLHEVNKNVVTRELKYKEGELYRRSLVRETQRRLYDLELFQFVSVRPDRGEPLAGSAAAPGTDTTPGAPGEADTGTAATAPGGSDTRPLPAPESPTPTRPRLGPVGGAASDGAASDGAAADGQAAPGQREAASPQRPRSIPMRITLTENKHRHVQFSAGYGTEEKARAEAEYRELNFLGGARTAAIHGKWSSLDRGLRLEFNNPYFFAPRWSVQVNGERWYDNEPAFTSVTSGAHMSFTFQPSTLNSYSVTLTDEYQTSQISNAALADLRVRSDLIALGLDPTTGTQAGTLNAIAFDARRNTSGNLLNPTRGYALTLHLEQGGKWVRGTYSYSNASLDGRYYLPLGKKLVVATRAQAGSIRPAGGILANVPFPKRYFLGGATSLRGWGRYELSPLSGSGLPIGGFSMFEATFETRMSLTRSLGAVAFVDLGNVWTEAWKVHLNDLRYDVGPGIRYNTPVGPLRVDLGYQLNPLPGLLVNGSPQSRRWRLHFSIGQAF